MTAHDFALMFYGGLYGCGGTIVLLGAYRLFHPWKCSCGHWHWSASRMMTHVEQKHVHDVRKK